MGKISEIFNFDNIGQKIKSLTKWSCWITILLIWIAAPIAFIVLVADDWTAYLCWIPLVAAIVGPIIVWIGSWTMYAFGELVDNSTHKQNNKKTSIANKQKSDKITSNIVSKSNQNAMAKNTPKNNDFEEDDYYDIECPNCGEPLSFVVGTTEAECPWCNFNIKIK